jgi:dihydrofolate reductase
MPSRVRYPNISFITARSWPGDVIGRDNQLPWHLRTDLKRFRELTTGHAVIMGRKTFDSIGKILPNRVNIVMSRELSSNTDEKILVQAQDSLFFASDKDSALFAADLYSIVNEKNDIFIIGGENVYTTFENQVNVVHLTLVFAEVTGDAYFRMKFPQEKWRVREEIDFPKTDTDEFPSRYLLYERRKRHYRYRYLREFYTDQRSKHEWAAQFLATHRSTIERYEAQNQAEQEELDL